MDQKAKFSSLRECDLFRSLSDAQIEQLNNLSSLDTFKRGNFLFNIGDNIKYIYLIQEGSVKVGMNTSNDKVLIKEIIYPGELLGENIFNDTGQRRLFAQTISETEAFRIPVSFFKAMLEQNTSFCEDITKLLITKMSQLENRMSNFVFKKAQSRIVDFLRHLAQTKGLKIGLDEILINHGLSHKEIANITDTSRQTVARVLGDLKRQNIIHFSARKPNKILIRDMIGLQ